MRVRILKSAQGPTLSLRSGWEGDLPAEIAKELIAHGIAIEIAIETAVSQPPKEIRIIRKKK